MACPYCRKTVTAPAESQIEDVNLIPTATPAVMTSVPDLANATSLSRDPQFEASRAVGGGPHNGAAMAAFILSCALLACTLSIVVLMRSHSDEMRAIQQQQEKMLAEGRGIFDISQQPLMDQFGGQMPPWILAVSGIFMMAFAFWVAALVCAIIGLRRLYRRHLAVTALAIVAIVPFFLCCGGSLWMGT